MRLGLVGDGGELELTPSRTLECAPAAQCSLQSLERPIGTVSSVRVIHARDALIAVLSHMVITVWEYGRAGVGAKEAEYTIHFQDQSDDMALAEAMCASGTLHSGGR